MDSYNSNLHSGASPIMYQHAHELKLRQTLAEKTLWEYIKGRKLYGLKFRRQHPLSIFIADFYCHEKKLVIELDGSIHDLQETKERTKRERVIL